MNLIKLTQGKETLIDGADFDKVSKYKWYAYYDKRTWYAARKRTVQYKPRKQIMERLHRFLLNAKRGQQVDHANGDGLDNRRCNIRICTHTENGRNQSKQSRHTSSKYKGVCWNKDHQEFLSYIKVGGKQKHLGCFKDKIKAALAYDAAALKYHKEFARLNFPTSKPKYRKAS